MNDNGKSYSSLSPDEQEALSVWVEGFEERFGQAGPAAIEQTLDEAPAGLRAALLTELLPLAIDAYRQQHGVTPTLHELRLAHPNLASEIAEVYPSLPSSYRLPVELHGYRVIRVVGDGGQAVVLRAQDDVHSTVAIKLSTSPEHNDLLLRERRILGECDHPGIVSVIGSGMHEEAAYFVMPYLKGKTLADRYATHRPDTDEAARIARELCGIVEHLHGHGILHRDIKPANVWIDDHGGVKLIDLGMAIERGRWGQPVSQLREFHGTPAFMSPEQAATDGDQDGELSDVFSVGATLYWMGTGSAPFDGGSGKSVLSKAAAGQFDRDRLAVASGWPKSLIKVCWKAMATSQQQRYRSASEMANALRMSATQAPRSSRRVVASVFVLAIAGLAYASLQGYPEQLWVSLGQSAETQPKPEDSVSDPIESDDAREVVRPEQAPPTIEPETEAVKEYFGDQPPPAPPGMHYVKIAYGPYLPDHPEGGRSKWVLQKKPLEREATPADLEAPSKPKLSTAERVAEAKAWLKNLPAGTQLGQFVGRRFHPTTLAPIRDVVLSIRITTGQERYGPTTILLGDKPDSFWDVPPERIRDNLLRPLRETDWLEYAFDSKCGVVLEPVEPPFIEIPPGIKSLDLSIFFADGSSLDHQSVGNLDRSLTVDVAGHHPRSNRVKLFLFRERTIGTDSIATYLKKPLSPTDPNRAYLLRTRIGFYCPRIPRYPKRAASTSADSVKPPEKIVPGTYYVHHFNSAGKSAKVVRYEVTREKLSELAEGAAYFERELRTQYYDANGRSRTP